MNQTHPWWWRGRGGVGDGDVVKWGQRRGGGSGGEWVVVMERLVVESTGGGLAYTHHHSPRKYPTLLYSASNEQQGQEFSRFDLLTQEYEKFSISNEETIDRGFTRLNAIVSSPINLRAGPNLRKNHGRKFLRALAFKNIYEMVLDNDGVATKTTKEKVKSLALKAKVTREQTSDDSDSQDGSDEDVDEEEEAEAFNLMAKNFRKFFCKGNRFGRRNQFGNGGNRFSKGRGNCFGNKGGESWKQKGACYNCRIEGHFASECTKPKENKPLVGGT
ncbi:retrovirus-related pol polyprotein from transposon TNT 1-94 [Tanacetum coccineum]